MPLKVLIVDDHEDFRKLLRQHITAKWADAQITEHDPVSMGALPNGYDGAGNQIVLLDFRMGTENGLDYLRRFRKIAGFPPVIMLTGVGTERLAVDAVKLGAVDYIPKQKMTHEVLISAMREALDARGTVERFEKAESQNVLVPERRVEIKGLRVVRKLGEGGMSTVYLAEQIKTGEQLVLKVFDQAKAGHHNEGMERFFQEYEIVKRLSHPGIVRIFEQGFTDDYAFITMEFFSNGSLRERLRQPITPDQALKFVGDIADSLEAVHTAGVVHRDLKPPNVMFRQDGSLVLIDFGVAKSEESADLTQVGTAVGTPHYMSPEQVDGYSPDARSDLYSLGVIFFEMLTGSVPFAARTSMAVLYKHKHAPIPELPAAMAILQPAINRFLAKSPEERFQSVAEIRGALSVMPKL